MEVIPISVRHLKVIVSLHYQEVNPVLPLHLEVVHVAIFHPKVIPFSVLHAEIVDKNALNM